MKPDVALEIDAFGSGQLETQPSFFKAAREGKIGIHAGVHLKGFKEKGVVLDNGEELPADTVFLATGYNPLDMTKIFAKENIQPEEDGYYLYRGIVNPELPNVYFVGSLSDTFSNITNGAIQSRWVAELLKGGHSLPDVDVMNADIEATKKWKRSWMPDGPSRGSHIQLHQVHYYDELIQDFKGKYKRKGNPIAEIFAPYHPADYKSLIEQEKDVTMTNDTTTTTTTRSDEKVLDLEQQQQQKPQSSNYYNYESGMATTVDPYNQDDDSDMELSC